MPASVVQSQLNSLDDTDSYATAWQRALQKQPEECNKLKSLWGGRGMGGRALARRTVQRKDIILDGVRLEYAGNLSQGSSRVLLENALLKLLSSQVYSLIGRNASGKSTLLKRINAGLIPGFPPHISTLLIPQEIQALEIEDPETKTTIEILRHYSKRSIQSIEHEIKNLETVMEGLDMTLEEDQTKMEEMANQMARLEEDMQKVEAEFEKSKQEALHFVGLADPSFCDLPIAALSPGLRKRSILAITLVCQSNLVLLDEPTNNLDIEGLLMLRDLVEVLSDERQTTVLMVSHDHDLMDDVSDHLIDFFEKDLLYYPGNYSSYRIYRHQNDLHAIRQAMALEKKRDHMYRTLENVRKQQGNSKRNKRSQASVVRKKIEKVGLEKDEHGHRWNNQKVGTGIRPGSINAIDATTRKGLSTGQLLDMAKKSVAPPPDKAIQFVFKPVANQWGEPLVMALDVGHSYASPSMPIRAPKDEPNVPAEIVVTKKEGMLFDCVDFCVEEGRRYCIVGESSSGKSTLLRILAKQEPPIEGSVKHALNLDILFLNQVHVDSMIETAVDQADNSISFLAKRFPTRNEHDIRAALTAFGLSPSQALTNVRFLSGGERCRLCLAASSLESPQLLIMDEPTANFDVESVEALIYGLSHWNGTVVMVSHDTNFIRALDPQVYALIADEGKLRKVEGGIDTYLRSFA